MDLVNQCGPKAVATRASFEIWEYRSVFAKACLLQGVDESGTHVGFFMKRENQRVETSIQRSAA